MAQGLKIHMVKFNNGLCFRHKTERVESETIINLLINLSMLFSILHSHSMNMCVPHIHTKTHHHTLEKKKYNKALKIMMEM